MRSDWLVATSVNSKFIPLFINWQMSLLSCCPALQKDIRVFCEDEQVESLLRNKTRFQLITRGESSKTEALEFGEKDYRHLVMKRPTHLLHLIQLGHNVLYTDVDTVFFRDPISHLTKHYHEDVAMSVDMRVWRQWKPYYCTGVLIVRSNPNTVALLQRWHKLTSNPTFSHYMNQPLLNMALRASNASVGTLDWAHFPPGNVLKKGKMQNTTVIAHANFVKGILAKISLLKRVGAWYSDERTFFPD